MADFSFVDGNAPSATNWNANVRDQLFVICTSSTRPSAPTTGRHIWETDTLKGYYYNGSTWAQIEDSTLFSAWTSYTPTWTGSGGNPAIGNGTITGRYRLTGKTLDVSIAVTAGSTTTFGTGFWSFSLPASLSATGASYATVSGLVLDASAGGSGYWPIVALSAGATLIPFTPTATADAKANSVASTTPMTWTTSDQININARLEVA